MGPHRLRNVFSLPRTGRRGASTAILCAALATLAIVPLLLIPIQRVRATNTPGLNASPAEFDTHLSQGPAASVKAPLRTEGARLIDADEQETLLAGVNWFGLETDTFAPHGLWARSYDDMLAQMVAAGFNTLRLPYSNQLFEPSAQPKGIDYQKNPDLQGLTGLGVMDRIVAAAGRHGLVVILDRHRPTAAGQSELWYTDRVSETRWIQDWVMLAQRYRGNPTIVGADLHNEPRGRATWGDGNLQTDWRLAAERAGNAILAVNPDWLIFVQGIERYGNDWYWWGGNLQGARHFPVRLSVPNKLVYSPHDYGPGVYRQPWFSASDSPSNLPVIWEKYWAYLQQEGTAPVFVGEFGGRSVGQDVEGIWQQSLLRFLRSNRISYTYWSWNPNSGDTGGILADDWSRLDEWKLAMLSTYNASPTDPQMPETADQADAGQLLVPVASTLPEVVAEAAPAPVPAASYRVPVAPPGARLAPGGPFDPDFSHVLAGVGGPNDPDPAHRQARAHDEQLYLRVFGQPWPYAAYVTGDGSGR